MTDNLIPVGKRFPRYSKNIELKTVIDLKTNKNVESLVCKDGEERVFIQNYLNEWEGIECKILFPETKYLILPEDEILTTKIFVIDEDEHHMFMLASEY